MRNCRVLEKNDAFPGLQVDPVQLMLALLQHDSDGALITLKPVHTPVVMAGIARAVLPVQRFR